MRLTTLQGSALIDETLPKRKGISFSNGDGAVGKRDRAPRTFARAIGAARAAAFELKKGPALCGHAYDR
jgi:hypothetical protein